MGTDQRGVAAGDDAIVVVVWLSGEHDRSSMVVLTRAVDAAVAVAGADVVFDLSATDFMDASTVDMIVRTRDVLAVQSRQLSLRAPSRCARRLVEVCGLTELWAAEPRLVGAPTSYSPTSPTSSSSPVALSSVERPPGAVRVSWERWFEQASA